MNNRYILMLESDVHDREITGEFFEGNIGEVRVEFLTYSHEVIPFLQNAESLPSLILLRINSVPETGLDILRTLKTTIAFKHLPVIILGENTLPALIDECYAMGANTVINKPVSLSLTGSKINSFIAYWFEVAELPRSQGVPHRLN
jgi:two-component system, response regulator